MERERQTNRKRESVFKKRTNVDEKEKKREEK